MAYANPPLTRTHDDPVMPWWGTLLSGIALLIVGFMLLRQPVATTIILVRIMAWFWLFEGVMTLVMMFIDRRHWGWKLFMGIVGIVAGWWLLSNPLIGSVVTLVTIVIILGVQALLFGVAALAAAFQGAGWGAAIMGVISIVLGVLLLFGNTLYAAASVPWVYGIFAIVGGVAAIVGAFAQRSHENQLAAGAGAVPAAR